MTARWSIQRFARPGAVITALVIALSTMARAQNPFEDAIKQFTSENVKGYLQPFMNSVGANINSGLYNTAEIGELGLTLKVQLIGMGTLIGDAEKSFSAVPPAPFPQTPVQTATVFGDMGASVQGPANLTYYFQNGQIKASIFPSAVPQLTIGNVFGTQAVLRYISLPEFQKFPKSMLFGIGAQHSISRYLPEAPVDLSVGLYYNKFNVGDIIESHSMAYGAHVSKSFAILTAYGGVQYETSSMDVNYQYTGQGSTPDTKVSLSLDSENKFRVTGGLNLNLGVIHLNADVSVGKVTTLSGGLGFGI